MNADAVVKIRACIAEAVPAPLNEVLITTHLMDDLEVDSLTLLDIVFRLEEAFDIEITRGTIEKAAKGDMSDADFAPGNVISTAGLAKLRELMPEAAERIKPGLKTGDIYTLFTVGTFVRIVEGIIE